MLKQLGASLLVLVLTGCATSQGPADQAVRMEPAFAQGKQLPLAAKADPKWWEQLEDPTLAALIEGALQANLDVRMAAERLEQARSIARGAEAARLPAGGASASAQRRGLSAAEAAAANVPARVGTRYDAGFDASWEIDLFGRLASQADAANASREALDARLADVRLSVAAEVARAYFELASALERRALALQSLERQQSIARLVGVRVKEGYSEPLDERRSQSDLAFAEANVPALEAEIVGARARLAVLLGANPTSFAAPTPVPSEPWRLRRLAIGAPERLLDTRPDLREAEAQVRSLRASAESVRAEFFPRLMLTGFLGFVSGGMGALGTAASESWLVAPRIGVPLFDLPRIQARLDAARSDERATLLEYRRRVLAAIEDVETSLARYASGQERLDALRRRAEAASSASRLARLRYEAGRSDFLELLEAERTATAAQSDVSLAVAAQRVAVVAVFKAFGAGWTD